MTPHSGENEAVLWRMPHCMLGESLLWDDRFRCFWWVDVHAGKLYRSGGEGHTPKMWQFDEALGHIALTEHPERIVLGLASGLVLFDTVLGTRTRLATVPHAASGMRLNDGRCDRNGHLVFGTMSEDGVGQRGAYWWFSAESGLRQLELPAPAIPNSICFSPDGARLYFTDSKEKIIYVCDYEAENGQVANIRVFVDLGAVDWEPDGSCVDAAGGVWNARWGGRRIVRYHPDGTLDRVIESPARQPTCPCFGGMDLDVLYATSARIGLDAQQLVDADGQILGWHGLGVKGLPEGRVLGL